MATDAIISLAMVTNSAKVEVLQPRWRQIEVGSKGKRREAIPPTPTLIFRQSCIYFLFFYIGVLYEPS